MNLLAACLAVAALAFASDRAPHMPMPVVYWNSAEHGWRAKPVLASRLLDPTSRPGTWTIRGNGKLTFPEDRGPMEIRRLRVDVDLHFPRPATGNGNGLPRVNLRRAFPGEDWSAYNRLSFWVRADIAGFPVLSLGVVLRNDGKEKVPDVYQREGLHYVTIPHGRWTRVQWEITPLARDKVVAIEFSPWVNKRLADPADRFAFEIGRLELERVPPDHYEGWNVAPGRIAFSHSGYQPGTAKTALASGLTAREFTVLRDDTGEPVWRGPVSTVQTRLGEFQRLDFSGLRAPGAYTIEAGSVRTRTFRIGPDAWRDSIWKTINFFYGERCGMAIPGIHEACHRDWQAVQGNRKIVMNGGWHDAGDLSQGLVNTAEATYAMFALAERTPDPALRARLIEEARWGLDWVLKVRFEGGYRIGFASMNLWTNGIIGDADDRTREALNNPNVNYLAATAEGIAYRVLKDADPQLAARALRTAEDDWRQAVVGRETPENLSTPAFAATEMELAAVGVLASVELYRATGGQVYADKARELARVVMDSQQRTYVGSRYPMTGFFYNGPDKKGIFRQFHRANDQAPAVAMAALCEAFPDHADWIRWYATAALYGEYQKRAAATTEPWSVLPAYIYRDDEWKTIPERDRYESSREAFREQVLRGMPMGDGYYLRAFPVWFARRGNYGVLLSQAKGLSAAARLGRTGDPAA